MHSLQQQLQKLQQMLSAALLDQDAATDSHRQQLASLQRDLDDSRELATSRQDEARALKQQLDAAREQVALGEEELAALKEQVDAVMRQSDEAAKAMHRSTKDMQEGLGHALAEAKAAHAAAVSELEAQAAGAEARATAAEAERGAARLEWSVLRGGLEDRVGELAASLEDAEARLAEVERQLASKEATAADLGQQLIDVREGTQQQGGSTCLVVHGLRFIVPALHFILFSRTLIEVSYNPIHTHSLSGSGSGRMLTWTWRGSGWRSSGGRRPRSGRAS